MFISSAAILAACGASDAIRTSQTGQPLGPICGTGQFGIGGQACYSAPTFADACVWAGGQPIISGTVCKLTSNFGGITRTVKGGVFPSLNPSYAGSALALSTGITVRVGDKVELRASSRWGEQGGFLGTSCNYVANGIGQDENDGSVILTNEGLPQGMLVSNGTEVYATTSNGTSGAVQTLQFGSAGIVRFGFNAPYRDGSCYTYSFDVLRLIHCEDASRNTVACP